jgi:ubiquinone/menaquinone biosynthesis C-methylase UbiE
MAEVKMASEPNLKAYRSGGIVRHYAQLSLLQPAEQTILGLWRNQLPNGKMLDIGIGGGRTTSHFAPLAGEYVGIDYSVAMVEACRQRFDQKIPNISLQVADARDMQMFADNTFDLILFSFNGIDYVDQGDRLQILKEIHRIGKKGSYFCFSSHNLQAMIKEFDWRSKLSLNPLKTYENLMMWGLLRLFNQDIFVNSFKCDRLQTSDYSIIKDESHNFQLLTYYIQPLAQIKQLEGMFKEIEIYSWQTGLKIGDGKNYGQLVSNLNACDDLWLYYLGINY